MVAVAAGGLAQLDRPRPPRRRLDRPRRGDELEPERRVHQRRPSARAQRVAHHLAPRDHPVIRLACLTLDGGDQRMPLTPSHRLPRQPDAEQRAEPGASQMATQDMTMPNREKTSRRSMARVAAGSTPMSSRTASTRVTVSPVRVARTALPQPSLTRWPQTPAEALRGRDGPPKAPRPPEGFPAARAPSQPTR